MPVIQSKRYPWKPLQFISTKDWQRMKGKGADKYTVIGDNDIEGEIISVRDLKGIPSEYLRPESDTGKVIYSKEFGRVVIYESGIK